MKDPVQQTRVELELLGKGSASLLPAIRDGFLQAADATNVMSTRPSTGLPPRKAYGASSKTPSSSSLANFCQSVEPRSENRVVGSAESDCAGVLAGASFVPWLQATKQVADETKKTTGDRCRRRCQCRALRTVSRLRGCGGDESRERKRDREEMQRKENRRRRIEAGARRVCHIAPVHRRHAQRRRSHRQADLWLQALKTTVPVSQMTADAQKQINAVLQDAMEAYAALGETAPEELRRYGQRPSTCSRRR